MTLLILGLLLFIGTHLIPAFPALRENIISKLGSSAYSAAFNILSLLSVVLMVFGFKQGPFEILYNPPSWGRYVNMAMMFFALYLFASNTKGTAPSSAKAVTAFPISWALIIWAIGHLFANGGLSHLILFGGLLCYGAISIITAKKRGLKPVFSKRPPLNQEAVFIAIIVVVYVGLFWIHGFLTGRPLIYL